MFYMCDDFNTLDNFITCSASEARSFLFNHPTGWVFKYSVDGQVTPIFLVEDIEVFSHD